MSIDRAIELAGTAMSLIGAGLVWVFPGSQWIGWVSIGLGILTIIVGFVWALAHRNALKEFEQREPAKTNSVSQIMEGSPHGRQVGGNLTSSDAADSQRKIE